MKWRYIPEEIESEWNQIFKSEEPSYKIDAGCPNCGEAQLFRYYDTHKLEPRLTGSCWQWCESCRVCTHFSCVLPEWWDSSLEFDVSGATVYPDVISVGLREKIPELFNM